VGQFFTEEDRDRGLPEELIKAAKTDGMVTDQGWRIRNDDSKIRTADTISASYDASGTIRGFGVMMRESTADPLAAELHRKTDYLDVIMEYSVQPLFMKDTSGEYLLANREFKQLYDIQDETVIGRTDYDLHPEEMAEKVWTDDRQVLETDEPVEIEEHVVVEGEERTYLSSKVPVYFDDDSDEPDAVFGMATDITERKEREQELRRSKRATDEAPVGITITDPDQDDNPIIYANNGFRSLTGYADDEILGRNCRFLQGEDTSPEAIATMRKAVDNEERVTVQLRNYREDGTEFWNRISIAPVHDDEGSVVNFVGFQQNITARKRKERQLERQLAQFEDFGGVVSHDLRTPLETVRGRVELARETGDIGHLQQAETALERLDALIDDLANVMREGELVNDVRSIALDEVVHAVWDTIETADETLTIEVNTSIQADEDALTRLVENLFKNAFEHGGADVSVTVGVLADGFYVEDDGPGVPVDERDRVFEAGYSTKPEGHGFGLASVRHLAVAHGWDITVTEGSDGGARFELTDIEIDDA
jgi:PAS domain S-box-containing protein